MCLFFNSGVFVFTKHIRAPFQYSLLSMRGSEFRRQEVDCQPSMVTSSPDLKFRMVNIKGVWADINNQHIKQKFVHYSLSNVPQQPWHPLPAAHGHRWSTARVPYPPNLEVFYKCNWRAHADFHGSISCL